MHPEIVPRLQKDELQRAGKLYVEAFGREPWNEKWTEDSATALLSRYLADGWLCCIRCPAEGVLALGAMVPLSRHEDYEQLRTLGVPDSALWYADWATDVKHWGRGFGRSILRTCIEHAQAQGAVAIASRTRVDNLPAIRIFKQEKFRQIAECDACTGETLSRRVVFSRTL